MRPLAAMFSLLLLASACGGDDDDDAGSQVDAGAVPADAAATPDATVAIDAGAEDLDMQAADFTCVRDGTKVHQFFVRNALGHLDEAVEVASSTTGGTYPVGTILQLIPTEAMVKRAPGWSPATGDWEFFSLVVSASGTTIDARGTEDVENAFGGNCLECHARAEPQWDLVCEDTHGCEPLGVGDDVITALQDSDPRCAD
ncbi:MAG TPA: hypothetical protein VK698_24185 [Kofleriaceae bacterium]|nr:hypothetical protein [Kofleriaceae bacterium]